tara:strand:- start:265 stop:444 length:180 start_codon:yes stop_codon:yes gene_type:complete
MDVTKDYLTTREAAQFCGVSYDHFTRERYKHGISAIQFMGKKLYRKQDLVKAIEKYSPK